MVPLFPDEAPAAALGLTAATRWHIAQLPEEVDQAAAWDMCHQMREGACNWPLEASTSSNPT